MIPYKSIPALTVFQADSNGSIDARKGDPILQQIDEILHQYHTNHGIVMFSASKLKEIMILGRLFSAVDMWLKDVTLNANRTNSVWKVKCKPAIESLYQVGCLRLAERVGVPINQLPFWITEAFGKGLSEHGVELDLDKGLAKYMDPAEADLCRIQFKGGKAYMRLLNAGSVDLVAASSDIYKNDKIFASGYAKHLKGHAGYVLSMGGDFFMGQHRVGGKLKEQSNLYHSSYRGGEAIRCAGTWKVEEGVVKEISDSSGHYQPNLHHMINALEVLKAYGVNLADLKVHYYKNKEEAQVTESSFDFLAKAHRGVLQDHRNRFINEQKVESTSRKKLSI